MSQCRIQVGSAPVVSEHTGHTGDVPEILEVELYRRSAVAVIGRRVVSVRDEDPIVVSPAGGLGSLVGSIVRDVHRHGKVLTITFAAETISNGPLRIPAIELHFGMTGRLIVDGRAALDSLVYGASDDERWQRFALGLDDGSLILSDPRRFGRVRIAREKSARVLGPDAFDVSRTDFVERIAAGSRRSIKGVLLDQAVVAGLGNMLVDEILLRGAVDPRSSAGSLTRNELGDLHRTMMEVLPELLASGGSHAGLLSHTLRRPGAPCPVDGTPLVKMTVAGRTSFVCPSHQVFEGSTSRVGERAARR